MNIRGVISTIKELLFVSPKDDITKRYLSTTSTKYQYIINCIERKEFDSNQLINENYIQEFTFSLSEQQASGNCNGLVRNVVFSNIGIGSTHFRDLHDFDLKVISKLAMLEFLARTNMGTDLFKDVKCVEMNSEFKQLSWSVILTKDKNFSGFEIQIPFILALVVDGIKRTALKTEDIFRKSMKFTSLMELFKSLYKSLNSDTNYIVEMFNCIYDLEPITLCSLLKMLLQNFSPLIPNNVLKFLYSMPDIKEPGLLILLYQCLMLQIPDPEKNILESVLELLNLVVKYKFKNNMCLRSISTLFAPVLLNPDHDSINGGIDVLIQMIQYREVIFLIPRNVLDVHRNDNVVKAIGFAPMKIIGKKTNLDGNNKSVVLSSYQHRPSCDFFRKKDLDKITSNNIFHFKYKKRLSSFLFNESSTISDVISMVAKENGNSSDLGLFENRGNIYHSRLHPNMKLLKAIGDNCSAKFVVDLVPKYDLINSTMKSLYLYLNIDVA